TVATDSFGRSLATVVDDRGRTVSRQNATGTTSSAYDDVSHAVVITHPDGTKSKATLDALDRVTRLETPLGTFQYTFGAASVPDQVVRPDGAVVTYPKTGSGELAGIAVDGVPVERVNHDGLGRIASVQQNGTSRSFQYDAAGRVTQVSSPEGSITYTYDA